MDEIDSHNPTNLEKKKSMIAKKCWKKYAVQDHHLIKDTRVIVLEKLTMREIYSVIMLSSGNTSTSQKYFFKVFPNANLDWKKIIYYQE